VVEHFHNGSFLVGPGNPDNSRKGGAAAEAATGKPQSRRQQADEQQAAPGRLYLFPFIMSVQRSISFRGAAQIGRRDGAPLPGLFPGDCPMFGELPSLGGGRREGSCQTWVTNSWWRACGPAIPTPGSSFSAAGIPSPIARPTSSP